MLSPELSIVIPAYNEQGRIGPTLDQALSYLDVRGSPAEIVVVDDGSRDRTAAIVREWAARDGRVRLILMPHNRGKGAAVRAGMLAAEGQRMLFMDADLAFPLGEIGHLEAALAAGADVAIGTRVAPAENSTNGQHMLREGVGWAFNLILRAAGLTGYRDTQCGFKLFSRRAARAIFSEAQVDRYAFDVEILLLCRGRFRVAEVPVSWRHVPSSKVNLLRDAPRMLMDVARLRLRLDPARRGRPS